MDLQEKATKKPPTGGFLRTLASVPHRYIAVEPRITSSAGYKWDS
jgi:hypothetical protein